MLLKPALPGEPVAPENDLRRRVAELEQQLAAREAELQAMRDELAQERQERTRVEAELQAMRDELAQERQERTRAEANLREQHRLLDALFEHAPLGIQIFDRQGTSLRTNKKLRAILGFSNQGYGVGSYNPLNDPYAAAAGFAALYQRAYAGEVVHARDRCIDLDMPENSWATVSGRIWYNQFIFPIFDDDGSVAAVVALSEDITEQRAAQDELNQTTSLLEGLFNHTPLGIQLYDYDGVSLRMNEAQAALLGFPGPEYGVGEYNIRTDPYTLVTGFDKVFDRVRAGEVVRLRDLTVDLADPANGWVTDQKELVIDCLAFPIRNGEGRVLAVATCLIDVSARVRAEAEVERLQAERKLLEGQRLHSLGLLTGGIAHDFNNLLAGILGYAQLALLDLPPDSAASGNIEALVVVARRTAELTQQLLAYAGKGRVVVQPLQLNTLIREMTDLLRVSHFHQASLIFQLHEPLASVLGDAAQIRQVVLNLLLNAAEALGAVEGTITVSTEVVTLDAAALGALQLGADLEPGDYVALRVQDTGTGMDSVTLAQIFEPFFTTKFTGRGLGLSAVQGIVRSHHGALDVQSVPGQGTAFAIYLPALPAEAKPLPQPPVLPEIWRHNGTLLVVDDEATVLTTTTRLLERLGYRVVAVASGPEGLERLRAGIPDLVGVILDLTMPEMAGDSVADAIHTQLPELPIVLMSGFSAEENADRYRQLGIAGFLQKPFSYTTLSQTLRQALVCK